MTKRAENYKIKTIKNASACMRNEYKKMTDAEWEAEYQAHLAEKNDASWHFFQSYNYQGKYVEEQKNDSGAIRYIIEKADGGRYIRTKLA